MLKYFDDETLRHLSPLHFDGWCTIQTVPYQPRQQIVVLDTGSRYLRVEGHKTKQFSCHLFQMVRMVQSVEIKEVHTGLPQVYGVDYYASE